MKRKYSVRIINVGDKTTFIDQPVFTQEVIDICVLRQIAGVRKCNFCESAYKSTISNVKYCSETCIKQARYCRKREQTAKNRQTTCLICGSSIEQTNAKITLYCSPACKQYAYRQRKAETARINI